ncbi:hypothetical protein V8E36_009078 [Tilletia maclaganii]
MRSKALLCFPLLAGLICLLSLSSPVTAQAAAGTKDLGDYCNSSNECRSGNCDYRAYPDAIICVPQYPKGKCASNDVCGSKNCTKGACVASPILGTCDSSQDCATPGGPTAGRNCDYDNKCYVSVGSKCSSDAQCFAGFCSSGTCHLRPQEPNERCSVDQECQSGKCLSESAGPPCVGNDGSAQFYCPDRYCARFPLGHACSNDGDCLQGLCEDRACVAGTKGALCVNDFQCTDAGALCSSPSGGKCITPTAASLFPQQHCLKSSQCTSGRCQANLPRTNKYDVIYELPIGSPPDPLRCDYLQLGESGRCRNYIDCAQGICKDARCVLGGQGDACLYTKHCGSSLVCGLNGKCSLPPSTHSLGLSQPCLQDEQCAKGNTCKSGNVTRPIPGNSAGATLKVNDTICQGSINTDGRCVVDADCSSIGGACREGRCRKLLGGEACVQNYQCETYRCESSSKGSSSSTTAKSCQLTPYAYTCLLDHECFSGQCEYAMCTERGCGPRKQCAAIASGGTCRTSDDCAFTAQCVKADRKCRSEDGEVCRRGSDCLSGACDDEVCVRAVKTTKTGSSSGTPTATKTPTPSA